MDIESKITVTKNISLLLETEEEVLNIIYKIINDETEKILYYWYGEDAKIFVDRVYALRNHITRLSNEFEKAILIMKKNVNS